MKTTLEAMETPPAPAVVGHWICLADAKPEEMPDDEISYLVWSADLDDAVLAYHDTEVWERRGDSGWVVCGQSRVILNVTHYCGDIFPPK